MNFSKKVIAGIIYSLLLGAVYYFYTESVWFAPVNKIVIDVEVDSKDNLKEKRIDLHIDGIHGYQKIETNEVIINKNRFTYVFDVNPKSVDFKLIRFDFENFTNSDKIQINKIELIDCFGKTKIALKKDRIIKSIYNYSESIGTDENSIYFTNLGSNFDPYVLLNVKTLLFFNTHLELILLIPWFILLITPIYKWVYEKFSKRDFEALLVSLFLIALPLKIAWVTFTILLLLLTSLIRFTFFSRRVMFIRKQHIIFFFLFSLYVVFGHVKAPDELSIQFAFILIPLIFVLNRNLINTLKFYEIYVRIFVVLMAIIAINGLIFLFALNQHYGITPYHYFYQENIKLLNQKMMWWLPYSHPTFLSSFFLVGLIFCQKLYFEKVVKGNLFFLYSILSLVAIIFLGSRLMLFMLLVYVIHYLFFKEREKQGVIFLFIISACFAIGLMAFIEFIDINRFKLWNISYHAISENFFGYGIDASKEVLTNPVFLAESGYDHASSENHSHNQFITVLLELGIFAVVLAFIVLGYLGYVLYKNSDKLFMSIYFLFFILLFTESLFKTATPIYYYTFIFCLSSIPNKNEVNLTPKFKDAI
ncbi:MAG: O-antigen ligase family protein [Ferruginibacter sp.]